MNGGIIGKVISFWAFIIGVVIFGKIFGLMEDPKTTIIILIVSALVFIVWTVGRVMAARKHEEQEWQARQSAKGKGNKRR